MCSAFISDVCLFMYRAKERERERDRDRDRDRERERERESEIQVYIYLRMCLLICVCIHLCTYLLICVVVFVGVLLDSFRKLVISHLRTSRFIYCMHRSCMNLYIYIYIYLSGYVSKMGDPQNGWCPCGCPLRPSHPKKTPWKTKRAGDSGRCTCCICLIIFVYKSMYVACAGLDYAV